APRDVAIRALELARDALGGNLDRELATGAADLFDLELHLRSAGNGRQRRGGRGEAAPGSVLGNGAAPRAPAKGSWSGGHAATPQCERGDSNPHGCPLDPKTSLPRRATSGHVRLRRKHGHSCRSRSAGIGPRRVGSVAVVVAAATSSKQP